MVCQRLVVVAILLSALASAARGQAIAQPNSPVELTSPTTAAPAAVDTEDQRLKKLAEQMAGKAAPAAVASPVASEASASIKAKAASIEAAPLAPKIDPKEKLPLGRVATPAAKGEAPAEANSSWVLTTLTALGIVVGLILLLRAGVAKMTGRTIASAQSAAVEVLSRTSVAPRNHVLLLRLGQRILVVGDSSAGLTTLANITDAEEVASLLQTIAASKSGSSTEGFSQMLDGFEGDYNSAPHSADQGGDTKEHRVDRARDGVKGLLSRVRTVAKGAE